MSTVNLLEACEATMGERHRQRPDSRRRPVVGLAAAAALVVLLSACIESALDPEDQRPCVTEAGNSNWADLDFVAIVTQPEVCPIGLDFRGDSLPLEGHVEFPRFQPDGFVEPINFPTLEVITNFGLLQKEIDLQFNENFLDDVWRAHVANHYRAGDDFPDQGADTLVFNVEVSAPSGFLEVLGRADLTYTLTPRMTISGPTSVSPQNFVELDVSVENGRLPLTYEWYHNDELVKMDVVNSYFNGYTTFGLETGTHRFDVIVTDADGDANNKSHWVESCMDCGS